MTIIWTWICATLQESNNPPRVTLGPPSLFFCAGKKLIGCRNTCTQECLGSDQAPHSPHQTHPGMNKETTAQGSQCILIQVDFHCQGEPIWIPSACTKGKDVLRTSCQRHTGGLSGLGLQRVAVRDRAKYSAKTKLTLTLATGRWSKHIHTCVEKEKSCKFDVAKNTTRMKRTFL